MHPSIAPYYNQILVSPGVYAGMILPVLQQYPPADYTQEQEQNLYALLLTAFSNAWGIVHPQKKLTESALNSMVTWAVGRHSAGLPI